MKKSELYLFKTAAKLQAKYAQSQTLQQILENAASYGEQSANGIMDFPTQLKKDQADLIFTVSVKPGMMGGTNVEVSQPRVDPPQAAGNYARLPDQIKKYLEKHIQNFPQVPRGDTVLQYSGQSSASPIASGR